MQNKPTTDENQHFDLSPSPSDGSSTSLQGSSALEPSSRPTGQGEEYVIVEQKQSLLTLFLHRLPVILLLLLLVMGGIFFLTRRHSEVTQVRAGHFGTVQLPLSVISSENPEGSDQTVKINGRLQVTDSLILAPTTQPTTPVIGQLYYDQTANLLAYYNGEQFVTVGGGTASTTIITQGGGGSGSTASAVLLQSSSPGVLQVGNFNISGSGTVGALKTSVIDSSGATLYLNPSVITASSTPGGVSATLGLTAIGSINSGTGINGAMVATKATLGDIGGTAKSITVYISGGSAANHIHVALYEDDGDIPSKPGGLLAASAITNLVPNAFNTLTIPSAALTANATYWLAFNTDDPNLTRPFNSGSKTTCFVSNGFGAMPDPFSAPGCFFANETYTIYANYTTASGGVGSIGKAQMSLSSTGQALFQNSEDSSTAFQVQNALGTSTVFNIDTANGRVAIGKASAAHKLDIAGGDINLSNGRSLRFGGAQALTVNGGGTTTSLTNFQSGGKISAQADNFVVQDANGLNNLISVNTSPGGDIGISTLATTGVSGDISITTGNSATTASGNITIDAGSGIVDGTVVETKNFESDVDNMEAWFGSTVTQSSAQAHGGTSSLAMTATGAFWGVIENVNNPITTVVPGHQYHFSIWVRAATTPRSITSRAVWVGGAATPLNLQTVTDSTTGWTEITGTGIAPAGATGVYPTMQSNGVVSEVHYFDDIVITDLSSSSAASTINIGSTNAKIVTIGNVNQIGATSILGGSGININSGVSGINLNGGSIAISGNAASAFSTSSGALTLTSADSATWGISTASSGVGGTLTVRAGGGGSDGNNDGGDIVLQGGSQNGTGLPGSVIVRPPTNVTDAFQIQNSSNTPLLIADSVNMRITVMGTDTTYATLVMTDAHFRSTQTTAPTIGTPANCGSSPTAVVTTGSTDAAGSFTITTGTGGTSSTCDTVITFRRPYAAAPKSILVVGKTDAASALRQVFVAGATTTTFTTVFGTSAGGADNTTYSFNYWVIE